MRIWVSCRVMDWVYLSGHKDKEKQIYESRHIFSGEVSFNTSTMSICQRFILAQMSGGLLLPLSGPAAAFVPAGVSVSGGPGSW